MLRFLLLFFISFSSYAWYPNKDSQEFRLVMASEDGVFSGLWNVEGQLINKKIISDSASLGGTFRLGEKESALAANVTYGVNKYFYVTVSGDLNNKKELGGSFWVSGKLREDSITYLPFALIDDSKVSSFGIIIYYSLSNVSFHTGISYSPPIVKDHHNIALMFGTSFENEKRVEKVKEVLGGVSND